MKKCCNQFEHALKEEIITYLPKFREFGIPINDGGSSFIEINFCPWCRQELPKSLRDEWFELIESKNLEPSDKLPEELTTDAWWRKID